ncbi:MAG: hypothetical protein JXB15_08185 [Anaerolineales bacterium]|nr:hypothetical protein [Anaerolineales bacterium]
MRTIRASEIGTYLFCQRAWWYQKQGIPTENQAEMLSGSEMHSQHGRAMLGVSCLRMLAYGLALLAVILVGMQIADLILGA